MKHLHKFLLTIVTMLSLFCFGQTIVGNLKFQSTFYNYSLVSIESSKEIAFCDSNGFFQISLINNLDTLEIIPFPHFIKVKIYNYSFKSDTIQFSDIPIFKKVNHGIPIANFRSKREAKKFYKEIEKKEEVEIEKLIKQIEESVFVWQDREYKLKIFRKQNQIILHINLGNT